MNWRFAIVAIGLFAAVSPWLAPRGRRTTGVRDHFHGWPSGLLPANARPCVLSARDARFAANFPGRIEVWSDARSTWILRWVEQPTRQLHPAADCFRGLGYTVEPGRPWRDEANSIWSRFEITQGQEQLSVRERIQDVNTGGTWSDVSAWYWCALWQRSAGPWIAVTRIDRGS